MENQPFWKAKTALVCYILLFAGILVGSIIVALILLGMGLDVQELTFPSALIALPINEGIILGITLLFANQKGAGLRATGSKKAISQNNTDRIFCCAVPSSAGFWHFCN